MSNVRCSVDGPDEEGVEVEGRRFSTNDEGVPMMCSLVCKSLGRHIHIDYCRAKTPAECRVNNEVEHIMKKLQPQPDRPKDFLAHNLFWKRSGNLIFVIVHPTLCLTHLQGSRIRIHAKIRRCLQNGRLIWLRSSSLPHTYTHLSSDSLCAGVLSLLLSRTWHDFFPQVLSMLLLEGSPLPPRSVFSRSSMHGSAPLVIIRARVISRRMDIDSCVRTRNLCGNHFICG